MKGFSEVKQISPVVIESSKIFTFNILNQNVTISQVLGTILLHILSFYFKDILQILLPNLLLFIFFIIVSNDYVIKLTKRKDPSETDFLNVEPICNKYNISQYLIGEKFIPLHQLSVDPFSPFLSNGFLNSKELLLPPVNLNSPLITKCPVLNSSPSSTILSSSITPTVSSVSRLSSSTSTTHNLVNFSKSSVLPTETSNTVTCTYTNVATTPSVTNTTLSTGLYSSPGYAMSTSINK